MSDLVRRLIEQEHNVEVSFRPRGDAESFENCLKRGYIHLLFPNTKGGTELGIQIDPARSNVTEADLKQQKGKLLLVGTLQLDFIEVRCSAEIDAATFKGKARLEEVNLPGLAS